MSALFLNHNVINCGVYQYGKRLNQILQKDIEHKYIYKEITSYEEYHSIICEFDNVCAIIYNYHLATMPWLNDTNIQHRVKNIGISHECPEHLFDIVCDLDPSQQPASNRFILPRPIYENVDEVILSSPTPNGNIESFIYSFTDSNIPIFGSFGFGFKNKGFDKIVTLVNEQYDNAVIKFVIPIANFDPDPYTIHKMYDSCIQANIKEGINLIITHEFLSDSDILRFLKSNTINLFMYDELHGRGISSAIDYALSVNRPIGISNSHMFRHIYSDDFCVYKNTIEECITKSEPHVNKLREAYSNDNVISTFKSIFESLVI